MRSANPSQSEHPSADVSGDSISTGLQAVPPPLPDPMAGDVVPPPVQTSSVSPAATATEPVLPIPSEVASVPRTVDPTPPAAAPFPWKPVIDCGMAMPDVTEAEEADVEEDLDTPRWLQKSVPAWVTSCIVHMVALIALGLIPLLVSQIPQDIMLVAGYTDEIGDQLDLETYSDTELLATDEPIQIVSDDLDLVEIPEIAPAPAITTPDGLMAVSDIAAPSMGLLLTGRDEGMREVLLAAYGGSERTEASVLNGLEWLQRRQDSDGLWSLTGKYRRDARSRSATYPSGGDLENKCAATAMAMLAFQGYGQTHQDGPHESFRRAMERAVVALRKCQRSDGSFIKHVKPTQPHLLSHQLMYTQALATFAMCELYAMSHDSALRMSAQKGVDFLVKHQHRAGGWKYAPGTGSDLSVTGWVMMALQSARMGGIDVPQETLYRVEQFLDLVAHNGGRRYSYDAYHGQTLTMTAEGMLCRQYLGWKQDDPRVVDTAQFLADNPISARRKNVYYWYYATQMLHNMEGKPWERWNKVMSTQLPAWQQKKGRERGSWSPSEDAWGEYGGRLYVTCMTIYMLEVYYRHLPIYSLNLDLESRKPE